MFLAKDESEGVDGFRTISVQSVFNRVIASAMARHPQMRQQCGNGSERSFMMTFRAVEIRGVSTALVRLLEARDSCLVHCSGSGLTGHDRARRTRAGFGATSYERTCFGWGGPLGLVGFSHAHEGVTQWPGPIAEVQFCRWLSKSHSIRESWR